jgi:hypothetical protein
MVEMRNKYNILNLKGRDHSKELGVDGKNMLEWISGK